MKFRSREEIIEAGIKKFKLTSKWCKCEQSEFHSYPEDGTCTCGMYKHHVHCAKCGSVSQIG